MKQAAAILLILTGLGGTVSAWSADAVPVEIIHNVRMNRPVTPEILGKKLFVDVQKSPKLSKALGDRLVAMGYKVVSAEDQADLKLKIYGFMWIGKMGGGSEYKAEFHELVDKAAEIDKNQVGGRGGIDATGVALSTGIAAGAFPSLTGMVGLNGLLNWLGTQSGLAGSLNKALTGDPRGICLSADCESFRTRTLVALQSFGNAEVRPNWMIESQAVSNKIVADDVMASVLTEVLKPFAEAARPAGQGGEGGKAPAAK